MPTKRESKQEARRYVWAEIIASAERQAESGFRWVKGDPDASDNTKAAWVSAVAVLRAMAKTKGAL